MGEGQDEGASFGVDDHDPRADAAAVRSLMVANARAAMSDAPSSPPARAKGRCNHDRCDFLGPHVHVSELETVRYWRDREDTTIGMLISDLREGKTPTRQMEAGKAFAKMWEHATESDLDVFSVDGWTFRFDGNMCAPVPSVRELQGELLFMTPHGPITLVGHCDGLDGREVRDQKLTEKWDAERYVDSLQWRAYLVMFDADRFVYDVFVGRYDSKGAPTVTITEYHPVSFFTYPQLADDVQRAVDELAGIFAQHLPDRLS